MAQLTLGIELRPPALHEFPTLDGPWVCRTWTRHGNSRPSVARHTTWGAAMVRALKLLDKSSGYYEAVEVGRYSHE